MEEEIKVSVIVPVYNVEAYLPQCLDSVIFQTLPEIEIICVNDCATDGSLEILKEYQQKDTRIIILEHEKNSGLSATRNTGAAIAKGKYLYFLDSDDYLELFALEKLVQKAETESLEVLFLQSETFFEEESLKKDFSHRDWSCVLEGMPDKVLSGEDFFVHAVEQHQYYIFAWVQLINRYYYEKKKLSFAVGMKPGEDIVFTFQNLMSAERVGCLKETVHHYRLRKGSITTDKRDYSFFLNMFECYKMILDCYVKTQREKTSSLPVYNSYFSLLRQEIQYYYHQITGQDKGPVANTLISTQFLLQNIPLDLIFPPKNNHSKNHLCFFGAGNQGMDALACCKERNWNLPSVICDNNQGIHGTEIEGIPIMSFQKALETFDNLYVVITNARYYQEILEEVLKQINPIKIIHLSELQAFESCW